MNKLKSSLLITIGLFTFALANLAQAENHHASSKQFKSTPLSSNVFMLQGKGGNIGLIKGKQGLLLIDADYKEMSSALEAELTKYGGITNVNYLINTHWHGDHTQGNDTVGHHAQIIAHENVRPRLLTSQEIKLFNMVTEPYPEHALPSITYKTKLSLHINNKEINVVHFPNGHTDGDSIVFIKSDNIVHMGDHFFSGMFPFVDVTHGGNVLNMAKNIKSVLPLLDNKTQVIPGHGPLSTKADLLAFHDMLVGTSAEVSAMKEKGLVLEKIQEKGLSKKWTAWTKGFIPEKVWIGIVYSSLKLIELKSVK